MHALATILLAVGLTAVVDPDTESMPPQAVLECMKSPQTKGLKIDFSRNPFYLRGDFDGDGKPDYALRVLAEGRPRIHAGGMLVCAGNGSVFLLGANVSGRKFSDKPNDNFFAPDWTVFTKNEVEALKSWHSNVPNPVPDPKREAIAMIWEDGIALVYWDGTKYAWAGAKE
jgi:hypothetical protein